MKTTFSWNWRSAAYAIACGCIAIASLFPATLLAQRDRGRGNERAAVVKVAVEFA